MGQRAIALAAALVSALLLVACRGDSEPVSGRGPAAPIDPFEGLPPLGRTVEPDVPEARGGPPPPAQVDGSLPPLADESPDLTRPKPLGVVSHPPLDGDPSGAIAYVFNQPMVDPSAAATLPSDLVRVTPSTPGKVSWLGDRTLVFTPEDRFRFATEYRAVLRPGLPSLAAQRLRTPVRTGFTTRTPSLVESRPPPGEVVDSWPVFSLRFNQPMDPAVVLAHLRLEGPGAPALRLDPRQETEPRVVRVEPTAPLEPSSSYRLRLPAGLSSKEGPLGSEQAYDLSYLVAGPQRLAGARCQIMPCLPGDVVQLTVAGERPTERTCYALEIRPPPEALLCEARANALFVTGRFRPGGLYLFGLENDAPDLPPIPLQLGRRRGAIRVLPDRPLLVIRPGVPLAVPSGATVSAARAAPVRPEMVLPVLQAIAAPDALAPFSLAEEPPRSLPVSPGDQGTIPFPAPESSGQGGLWLLSLDVPSPTGSSRRVALVQVTALGLTVRYGWDSGVAVVTEPNGTPRPKTSLVLRDRHGAAEWRGETDAAGLARFPGRRRLKGVPPYALWAESPSDRTFVVLDGGGEDGPGVSGYHPGQAKPDLERLVGAVLTDRRRYPPGGRVRFFGVLRGETRLPRGTIGHLPHRHSEIGFRVTGPHGEEITSGRTPLGAAGLFTATVALPSQTPPGRYALWISLASADRALADWVRGHFLVGRPGSGLRLRVQRPETPPRLDQRPPLTLGLTGLGEHPLAGASLHWQLFRYEGAAPPAGFPRFRFTVDREALDRSPTDSDPALGEAAWVGEGQGLTDALGELHITPTLTKPKQGDRATFELLVNAETLDGRHLRRSHRFSAHRLPQQLGLHVDRPVALEGEAVEVTVVALSAEGAPTSLGPVSVQATREGHGPGGPVCEVFPGAGSDSCLMTLPAPGRWTLRAHHPEALPSSLHVVRTHADPRSEMARGQLELRWAREALSSARPARLLLRTPVSRGTALVTVEREGLAWAQASPLAGYETLVELPRDLALPSSAWLNVSVVQPERTEAEARSPLSVRTRIPSAAAPDSLQVSATLPKVPLAPGRPLAIDVQVRDPWGNPTRAALFVHVTPQAGRPPHPDFAAMLGGQRDSGMTLRTSRALLTRSGPDRLAAPPRTSHDFQSRAPSPWLTRERWDGRDDDRKSDRDEDTSDDTAPREYPGAFRGPLLTDARGRLTLRLPLARRHRRHHLVILAADPTHPDRFGRLHRPVEATPPFSLRVQTPNRVRLDDRLLLPVTLHNRTPHPGRAELRVRSTGAPVSPTRVAVDLPAGARRTTHLRLRAAAPGLTRIQLGAWLGPHRSVVERRVIVQDEPRASGLRSRMGAIQGTARLPISPFGTHRVSGSLTLTLARSPYLACRELMTRLALMERPTLAGTALGLLALSLAREGDFRSQLAPWLDEASYNALGKRALDQLRALRLRDGGFRRHLGGPSASIADVGLVLMALGEAQASGLGAAGALAAAGQDRLQILARDAASPREERTLALAVLRATRQFLRPDVISAVGRADGGLSPRERARLDWVQASMDPAGKDAKNRSRPQATPRQTEVLAMRLLALVERGADAAAREHEARLLFDALGGQATPWELAWSLLALRANARLSLSGRERLPLGVWMDRRFLGRLSPTAGHAALLYLRAPLEGGRAHAAILDAPKTGWTYYHAYLQAPVKQRHAHPDVSLATSYELHRSGAPSLAPGHGSTRQGSSSATDRTRLLTLSAGDTAVGRITLVTTDTLDESVLRVPLPAGARLVDAGRLGLAPEVPRPWRQRFPALPVLEITPQDDSLFLHVDALPPGIHEHRWVIQATLPGRFRCEVATLRRADNDHLLAASAPCDALVISRPAAP